jgi:hypothetical protein
LLEDIAAQSNQVTLESDHVLDEIARCSTRRLAAPNMRLTNDPDRIHRAPARTAVQSSDGREFGTVEAVLQVEEVDVLDGSS